MIWHVLAFAVVFLHGVMAGLFLGSCLTEHAMRGLDGPHWLAYKQAKEVVYAAVMPPLSGVTLLATIAAAVLTSAHAAFAVAAVLFAISLVITVRVHLPLNTLFESWTAETLPADWDAARKRWREWNWARCASAVVAFAATLWVVWN